MVRQDICVRLRYGAIECCISAHLLSHLGILPGQVPTHSLCTLTLAGSLRQRGSRSPPQTKMSLRMTPPWNAARGPPRWSRTRRPRPQSRPPRQHNAPWQRPNPPSWGRSSRGRLRRPRQCDRSVPAGWRWRRRPRAMPRRPRPSSNRDEGGRREGRGAVRGDGGECSRSFRSSYAKCNTHSIPKMHFGRALFFLLLVHGFSRMISNIF